MAITVLGIGVKGETLDLLPGRMWRVWHRRFKTPRLCTWWDLFQLELKLKVIFHTRREAANPLLDAAVKQRTQAEQVWPEDLGPGTEGTVNGRAPSHERRRCWAQHPAETQAWLQSLTRTAASQPWGMPQRRTWEGLAGRNAHGNNYSHLCKGGGGISDYWTLKV